VPGNYYTAFLRRGIMMENKLKYPREHPELNQIKFDEKHKQHVLNSIKGIPVDNKKKKNRAAFKKLGYSSLGAAILFVLIIGSTYFSLDMAKVAAKIPYFSVFIAQEEYKFALHDVVSDVINENEYKISDLKASIPDKKITIWLVGSKKEINNMKDDVVKNLNGELVANNFGKYEIEIKKGKERQSEPISKEDEQYIQKSQELEKKVIDLLEKNNYKPAFPVEVRINKMENFIYIALPKTEKRVPELKEQLKSLTKDYGEFRYRITSIDMAARDQELRWEKNGIIHILVGGLMENKSFKVTGFSYSFHPLPLQIKIKTSVNTSDPDAEKLAAEIEKEITEFIQTHEKTAEVRNDPYELIIYSKDKKKIN
jgi:hypothetical protein